MKTLILGLGNTLLKDDGIGIADLIVRGQGLVPVEDQLGIDRSHQSKGLFLHVDINKIPVLFQRYQI